MQQQYDYDRSASRLRVATIHHQKYEVALKLLGFPSGARPTPDEVDAARRRAIQKAQSHGNGDTSQILDAAFVAKHDIPEVLEEKDRDAERERQRAERVLEQQIESMKRQREQELAEGQKNRDRAKELGPERRRLEKDRKQNLPGDLRHEKYPDARARILQELPQHGWTVKPNLKVPWAKRRNDRDNTVWFKAQAVYLNEHSLFLDIRGMPTTEFIKRIETQMDRS
jgi:hypothetical protein